MKIIGGKNYNDSIQLEIENSLNKLGYASYHTDTDTITLDGEFSLMELEAILKYMKEC